MLDRMQVDHTIEELREAVNPSQLSGVGWMFVHEDFKFMRVTKASSSELS